MAGQREATRSPIAEHGILRSTALKISWGIVAGIFGGILLLTGIGFIAFQRVHVVLPW